MIQIKNISKSYNNNENLVVFKNISIDIPKGKIVSIMGESGVGKTTFLNIVGGLIKPDSGTVIINDTLINENVSSKMRIKTFGFIFQSHCLLNEFTVIDNLMLPQIIAGKS